MALTTSDCARPQDIFSSFSTFLFAFLTHTMVPQVVSELVEPSTTRLCYMMGGVCGGSLSLYMMVGLTGEARLVFRAVLRPHRPLGCKAFARRVN